MGEPNGATAAAGQTGGRASPLVPVQNRTGEGTYPTSNVDRLLLGLALALAAVLNWPDFVRDCLSIDEHVSFWIADRSSPSTLLVRSFRYSATPPFSFVLQRVSLEIFGPREWALRLPAALSFLGAVAATWWFGRRWISPLAGGLAAILLAAHPIVQSVAVAGRPYSVGLLLGVLAMHCTATVVADPKRRLRWIGWVLVNLGLVHTHYLFGALWAAEFLWLAWPAGVERTPIRQSLSWWAVLLVLSLSITPGLVRVWEHRQYLNWTTRTPVLADLVDIVLPVSWDSLRRPVWWAVVAMPFLWQLLASRRRPSQWPGLVRWSHSRGSLARIAIWFLVPAGGLWAVGRFWIPSLAAERYLIVYTPAAALVVAGVLCTMRGEVAPTLAVVSLLLLQGIGPRLCTSLSATQRFLPWIVPTADRPRDLQDSAWRNFPPGELPATPGAGDLVLVGSGLIEMTLVPAYFHDSVFHDYVSCRFNRLYVPGDYMRLSLPMYWPRELTPDLEALYRRAVMNVCGRSKLDSLQEPLRQFEKRKLDHVRSLAAGDAEVERMVELELPQVTRIYLVCATDTDLLRASAAQADVLLKAAGCTELYRKGTPLLTVVYSCPRRPSQPSNEYYIE